MRRKLLVKVDGIDGCGKTSLIEAIRRHFSSASRDFRVLVTKEFGSSQDIKVGNIYSGLDKTDDLSISQLLALFAKSENANVDDIERELIWMLLSRRTNRIIVPELRKNYDLILVDRSNLGNICYGAVIDSRLRGIYKIITDPLEKSDIIFWIDTPVEICDQRLKQRKKDIVEAKGISFFRAVQAEFKKASQADHRIIRLDGTKALEELVKEAIEAISEKMYELWWLNTSKIISTFLLAWFADDKIGYRNLQLYIVKLYKIFLVNTLCSKFSNSIVVR